MSDERERGFARIGSLGGPTSATMNPDGGSESPDDVLGADGPGRMEKRPARQEPLATGRMHASALEVLDTAATEQELLVDELHDPIGVRPREPARPLSEEQEAELRALREKLYNDLAGLAPTMTGSEQPQKTESNMFAVLSNEAQDVAKKRIRPIAARHARKLVIGLALLVGAGLVVNGARDRAGTADASAAVALDSNFGAVRNIVREPGLFLRNGLAGELGEDYARGAATAEVVFYDEAFMSVTDPEARLAITSSAIERALIEHDTRSLVLWLRRLEGIEGAGNDRRTATIREKGYLRLAEVERAAGRDEEAVRWARWSQQESEKARTQRMTLAGTGWTPAVAAQLRLGLDLARARLSNNASENYRAGYQSALAEAEQALGLMREILLTSKRTTRAR